MRPRRQKQQQETPFLAGISLYIDVTLDDAAQLQAQATSAGADVKSRLSKTLSHIVTHPETRNSTIRKYAQEGVGSLVKVEWLRECLQSKSVVKIAESHLPEFEVEAAENASDNAASSSSKRPKKSDPELKQPAKKQAKGKGKAKAVAQPETEDEEEPKQESLVKEIRKGRAVVDRECHSAQSYHVWDDDEGVWDATLNQTNISHNNNKYYLIQLLKHDVTADYYVWRRWGRVGHRGQTDLESFGPNLQAAKKSFCKKFHDKTLNHWDERDQFEHHHGKYDLLQRDYGEVEDESETAVAQQKTIPVPKLEKRVQELVSLIFDTKMMTKAMVEIGYDAQKMPLGKLTKAHIQKGYHVLKEIAAVLNGETKGDLKYLSSRFYTIIPHDFGRMVPPVIGTKQMLKQKLEMVESLADIQIATSLISASSGVHEHPLDSYYASLKAELTPLPHASMDWKVINDYITLTHAPTHSNYKLELLDVYHVGREGENSRFEHFADKHRMLLWHGSRLSNFVGILSQGLRIAPPEAPVTGYMFGKGIYFADMVSKSANYCNASRSSPVALLLLSDVALGDMKEFLQSDYHADREVKKAGALSCKGVGGTQPDPSTFQHVNFEPETHAMVPAEKMGGKGVVVPTGKPVVGQKSGALLYNEYIVYDTAQVQLRYLVKVRFQF